ncbi:dnaJ homolog subfamily C member 24 isoform X1 [Embiotoca jacksoni]|uniref:dnaJ homolog subfamily C member 24 isoform X1 n=1 Tax=Embiotoca jacksoni TaxID=100190 RepID=UPI0037042900
MCEAPEKDLYAVLGAGPSDSVQQLRHRYQQLALQYHPDRLGADCSSESTVEKFVEVDAAWKILGDPTRRRQYDLQRRAQELKQDWPVDSTVCLQDMSWDEDECLYTYCCRCGGGFSVTEEETRRTQQDDEEEETEEGQPTGVVVCCDTCSLSVFITWPSERLQSQNTV